MKHMKTITAAVPMAILMAVVMGLVTAGTLCAQDGRRERQRLPSPVPAAEKVTVGTVTVSGPLQLVNGRIAVAQEGKTYYADSLGRLVGFIEALREGAQVTLTGRAEPLPFGADSFRLRISAMTLNGKVYDNLDSPGRPDSPGNVDNPGNLGNLGNLNRGRGPFPMRERHGPQRFR
jgi:hypothetical protein